MEKSLGVAWENFLGWSPSKRQSPHEGDKWKAIFELEPVGRYSQSLGYLKGQGKLRENVISPGE